eukprot:COSAG01_NODE_51766_length_352_cov_0.711462_1_plen_47_part_10
MDVRGYDYCDTFGSFLVSKGATGCTVAKKCSACQGDCDRDADCKTGL